MAVNQKHTTIASINYLIELSAIPYNTRNEYLELLLKRKNAYTQKNVKLLKCIYDYVNENRLSEWDPKKVCSQTGLNMNALYIQKSRLLKGLREYYFNWKKTECEIKEKSEQEQQDRSIFNENEKEIALMLEKARKMAETGMVREAKTIYTKIEKKARISSLQQIEIYLILSEIYEYQSYYFFNKRDKRKLQFFINKLSNIIDVIRTLNTRINERQKALLEIRLNFIKFHHYCIEWYKNPKAKMQFNFPVIICSLSRKFDYFEYFTRALHGRIIIELVNENYETAKELCREGFKISGEQGYTTAKHTFASMLYYINLKNSSGRYKHKNENILSYYEKTKKDNPFNLWTIYLENSIVMAYHLDKRKEVLDIFREQITSNIILGDFGFSVFFKFVLDSELYNDKLLSYFNDYNIHFKGYLEIQKIDNEILDDIKKICLNTECYHTRINDFGLTWQVHKLKLISYFFREDDFEYDDVENLLKIMAQLKKNNKIIPGIQTYELLKLSIKMLEHLGNSRDIADKYELKFKKAVDSLKENPQELTSTDYAIVSSLARRLRCREITGIVKDFYNWLISNHPEILAPALREIEERTSRVKLIDGSKQSAA
jgi:hypothetical protein